MENKKVKIAVFVSGGGTNLQALIESQRKGEIKSGILSLIMSNKIDAYALERGRKAGIESIAIDKKSYDSQEQFEKKIIEALEARGIEFIVLAGFMCILSEGFIKRYENRIINVHPSLIPSFCGKGYYGLRVHEAALNYGVKVTGATVHFVNEIPDGGKIIEQKAVRILKNDTPESLQKRVMRFAEWKILPKATEMVCRQILSGEI